MRQRAGGGGEVAARLGHAAAAAHELDNVERLRGIDFSCVVASAAELETALDARLKELSLAWNTSSS